MPRRSGCSSSAIICAIAQAAADKVRGWKAATLAAALRAPAPVHEAHVPANSPGSRKRSARHSAPDPTRRYGVVRFSNSSTGVEPGSSSTTQMSESNRCSLASLCLDRIRLGVGDQRS